MVVDGLMQHLFSKPFDDGGKHVSRQLTSAFT